MFLGLEFGRVGNESNVDTLCSCRIMHESSLEDLPIEALKHAFELDTRSSNYDGDGDGDGDDEGNGDSHLRNFRVGFTYDHLELVPGAVQNLISAASHLRERSVILTIMARDGDDDEDVVVPVPTKAYAEMGSSRRPLLHWIDDSRDAVLFICGVLVSLLFLAIALTATTTYCLVKRPPTVDDSHLLMDSVAIRAAASLSSNPIQRIAEPPTFVEDAGQLRFVSVPPTPLYSSY